MTRTVVIHDVPPSELGTVLADLERDAYNTSYYLEPDGEFTVIGTKEVPNAQPAQPSGVKTKPTGSANG